jgi:catecholate siderophore receptor
VFIATLVSMTGWRCALADPAAPAPARSESRRAFAIPAQPLPRALAEFSRESGVSVSADPALISGRSSIAIAGFYRPADALRLLIGPGQIAVSALDAATLALAPAVPSTIGSVSTSSSPFVPTRSALGKYTRPLVDTPQTIVEVPAQVIEDQNATTLHDALRNVSGISLAAGEGGSQGDSLTIRGFDAKDDFYLDGMRDFGNYYRDPFDVQRVEVIMGPASMLLGHGEGGGIVNQVSKTPALGDFSNIALSAGTDALARATIDDNIQLSPTAALRVNGMAETTHTADRDVTMSKRLGFAPSLALGLGTADRFTFSLLTQADDAIPDYGIPYINDRPANVPRSNFYGFADGDRLEDDNLIGTITFEHDFNPNMTLHTQLRYASYERSFGASDALTPSPQPPIGESPALITVARTQHSRNGHETFLQSQSYVTAHIGANTVMYGYEATRETSHETSNTVSGLPSTNVLDPTPYQPFTYTSIAAKTDNHVTADTLAFFAADSLALGKHFEFDTGARWDTFDAQNNEYVSGTSAVQDVRKLTPQASFVYKPRHNGSIYIAYDTSFQPSADALSLTTAQLVAPASNTTYELGTKWNLNGDRLSITGSIFNSIMYNAHITEPDGTVLPVGTERSNGFQTQIQGTLSPHWRLMAGYTLLETDVLAYVLSTQPGVVGTHIPNAPTGSASMWSEYTLSPSVGAGLGVEGLSQRQASIGVDTTTGQPILVPGYMRVDGELRFRLSPRMSLQINGYNLLDKYYIDEIHPDHAVPGAGRSVDVTLRIWTGSGR